MPLRALTMHKGEHVRWYVFAGTNDFDAHSPHWHGNTVVINQMRTDVTSLAPMQMVTAAWCPTTSASGSSTATFPSTPAGGMVGRYAVAP